MKLSKAKKFGRDRWHPRHAEAQRGLARYYRHRTELLRRKVEVPQHVRFWGREYVVTPRFVARVHGDGLLLVALQPLNTRPERYVLRVDSRWDLDDDAWYDLLDDVKEAVEDEYMPHDFYCELCGESSKSFGDCECQADREWPAADFSVGCGWWELWWPA